MNDNGQSRVPEPFLSIGIIAWNEAETIGPMLDSVFSQSLFGALARRQLRAEILCIANGCTDGTAEAASRVFEHQKRSHPQSAFMTCRAIQVAERGKLNAWNLFVHSYSARQARYLCLMDADILVHNDATLESMCMGLEENKEAWAAVDRPCKDISFRSHPTLLEKLSLAASELTSSSEAQLCGQLYCIRAPVARKIRLPRHLAACDDGFIKTLICTDFLTRPPQPRRILVAPNASHTFQAYTSISEILKNQTRQVIGQTLVHILVDQYLRSGPGPRAGNIGMQLEKLERDDPDWLKRLIGDHLRRTRFCWQLYPRLLSSRFKPLKRFSFSKRILRFPAALAGSLFALVSSWRAYSILKAGQTEYWPRAKRRSFGPKPHPARTLLPLRKLHQSPN